MEVFKAPLGDDDATDPTKNRACEQRRADGRTEPVAKGDADAGDQGDMRPEQACEVRRRLGLQAAYR